MRILLEGVQRLDRYGMGTSSDAIQELILGLEFDYDPIYRILNGNYGSKQIRKTQNWISSEFGTLRSMDVDNIISVVKNRTLPSLITACKVIENKYRIPFRRKE